jgi:hypothetical protein
VRKDNGYNPTATGNVRVIPDPVEAEKVRLTEAQDYADRLYHFTNGREGVCYCEA